VEIAGTGIDRVVLSAGPYRSVCVGCRHGVYVAALQNFATAMVRRCGIRWRDFVALGRFGDGIAAEVAGCDSSGRESRRRGAASGRASTIGDVS
jgi:hypothetical protein